MVFLKLTVLRALVRPFTASSIDIARQSPFLALLARRAFSSGPQHPETVIAPATKVTSATLASTLPVQETDVAINTIREDPILSHFVNIVMRDGKKIKAQHLISDTLVEVRRRTNSDPYAILREALETLSPLLRLVSGKKGSKVIRIPTTLTEKQRRRIAINWLLLGAKTRKERTFPERLSGEILGVLNGTASGLAKKTQLHKEALANRQNIQGAFGMGLQGGQRVGQQGPPVG